MDISIALNTMIRVADICPSHGTPLKDGMRCIHAATVPFEMAKKNLNIRRKTGAW